VQRHDKLRESWQDYHQALRGVAEIMFSLLWKEDAYKRASIARRKKSNIDKISFQRTPKTILNYY